MIAVCSSGRVSTSRINPYLDLLTIRFKSNLNYCLQWARLQGCMCGPFYEKGKGLIAPVVRVNPYDPNVICLRPEPRTRKFIPECKDKVKPNPHCHI